MVQSCVRMICDETGATAIEYALIAGLIASVLFVTVATIDDSLIRIFEEAAEPF